MNITALFWANTQRVVVISCRRFGTDSLSLKSARNCHYSLYNSPEECSSHIHRAGSFQSHREVIFTGTFLKQLQVRECCLGH